MRRDIVLVHIPKTAGTSVRIVLELAAADHLILRDYGHAPESTPALRELVHEQKRIEEFRQHFNPMDRGILLSGHFPAWHYWRYFNAESFVTFIRDPVDRVLSEYNHFLTHQRWTVPLEEFAAMQRFRNVTSKFLTVVDLDRFGFIGIMEEFDASMSALARFVGAELPFRKVNLGDYGAQNAGLLARSDHRAIVTDLNQEDVALYKRLRETRSANPCSVERQFADPNNYRGRVRMNRNGVATGWLCNTMREFIAEVEVLADGRSLGFVKADRYSQDAKDTKFSRSGVCGFRVDVQTLDPAGLALSHSAKFTFRARGTDYQLEGSPATRQAAAAGDADE
jgi:Sulfotransferase family